MSLSQPRRNPTLVLIAVTTVSRLIYDPQFVFSSDVQIIAAGYIYSTAIATPVEKSAESLIICYTSFRTIKPPLLSPVFLFSPMCY